jgi:hypothetical protein
MTYIQLKRRLIQLFSTPSRSPEACPVKQPIGEILHLDNRIQHLYTRSPDALVEMGRDIAASILAHPEKYLVQVMGTDALVVDDAAYDALFYLFSGKTRKQLWEENSRIAAIMLFNHTIISQKLLADARRAEQGWR